MASKSKTTIKGTLGAPIRGLLAGLVITLISGSAHASLNPNLKERILRKAERVNRLAQTKIDTLDNQEGRQLQDLLNQALRILRDQDTDPAPGPNPNPDPYPNPGPFPPPASGYSVQARLDQTDVSFDGYGLEQLEQQCAEYLRAAQPGNAKVFRIDVNGQSIQAGWQGFNAQRTCAILAVNASPLSSYAGAELEARLDAIPVRLRVASRLELQQAIESIIPRVIGGASAKVFAITLNGKKYEAGWQGYSSRTATGLLKWNSRDALGFLISEGAMDNLPFVFTGTIPSELESQCLAYAGEVLEGRKIFSITVNGQRRDAGWQGFTTAQLCMTVKTLAKQNH